MSKDGRVGRRPQVSDDEITAAIEDTRTPVATTADIADRLSIGKRGVLKRLKQLEERGLVTSMSVGARGRVWWIPGDREEPTRVDPDDPFWNVEPGASGEHAVSERVDEILYGKGAQ